MIFDRFPDVNSVYCVVPLGNVTTEERCIRKDNFCLNFEVSILVPIALRNLLWPVTVNQLHVLAMQ